MPKGKIEICRAHQKKRAKRFRCDICLKGFTRRTSLTDHARVHTGERPHKCGSCGKCFRLKSNMVRHMRIHSGERSFICEICSKAFLLKTSLKIHLRIHTGGNPLQCAKSPKNFKSPESLKIKKYDLNKWNETWTCVRCQKYFSSYTLLKSHYEALKLCSDVCSLNLPIVHRDEQSEAQDMNFSTVNNCTLCESSFSSEKELKTHIKLSHYVYGLKQEIDGELIANIETEHPRIPPETLYSEDTDCVQNTTQCKEEYNETEYTYQCGGCVQSFANEIDLKIHAICHAELTCKICTKNFQDKSELEKHVHRHTADHPFQCEICSKRYSRKSVLLNHMRLHTGELLHKCDECGRGFGIRSHLLQHKMRAHSVERPFKCEFCPKTFSNKWSLTLHSSVHTGKRPFQCVICPKNFNSAEQMKAHLRVHTGERPFQCDFCDKSFKTKRDKKLHLSVHSQEHPFQCEVCGKHLKSKRGKEFHLRRHTNERTFQCELCEKCFKTNEEKKKHSKTCKGPAGKNLTEASTRVATN